jgi:anti-anti-sigma factor
MKPDYWAIDVKTVQGVTVLRLHGKFVIGARTDEFGKMMDHLLADGRRWFLVNLLQVPWLDSAAIAELFEANRKIKKVEGKLLMVVQGKPLDILSTLYIHDILSVHEDEQTALRSFRDVE